MRKIIIVGMCILLLLVTGAGYRFYLSQYQEECYRNKIYYWNETYCKSYLGGYESEYKNNNQENPCCADNTFNFTWGNGTKDESRWCYGFPFNKTLWKFTDECAIYHLVRYV